MTAKHQGAAGGLLAIAIDRNSPVPPSVQVEQALRSQILVGEFQGMSRLPPEIELARQFGVSRMTLRSALQRLADAGLLERRQGVGTILIQKPAPLTCDLGLMVSFVEQLRRAGRQADAILDRCERVEAPPMAAASLGLALREPAILLRRIIRAEEQPVAINTSWVPARLAPGLETIGLTDGSLWKTLKSHFGLNPQRADNTIDFVEHQSDDMRSLQASDDEQLVRMTGLIRDATGQPIELSVSLWKAANTRFRFSMGC